METATEGTEISPELAARAERDDLLTLGVEEEYLLADATEPRAAELVEEVFAELPADLRDVVQHEYYRTQIEVASPPFSLMTAVRRRASAATSSPMPRSSR